MHYTYSFYTQIKKNHKQTNPFPFQIPELQKSKNFKLPFVNLAPRWLATLDTETPYIKARIQGAYRRNTKIY